MTCVERAPGFKRLLSDLESSRKYEGFEQPVKCCFGVFEPSHFEVFWYLLLLWFWEKKNKHQGWTSPTYQFWINREGSFGYRVAHTALESCVKINTFKVMKHCTITQFKLNLGSQHYSESAHMGIPNNPLIRRIQIDMCKPFFSSSNKPGYSRLLVGLIGERSVYDGGST